MTERSGERTRVLFVCMGNICRSPTAEGVFRHVVEEAGLAAAFEIDSAGTISYHAGEPPDARATQAARRRGIDLSDQLARQVRDDDFARFDHVLAMDHDNLSGLLRRCPDEHAEKVRLFLPIADGLDTDEVPDPYYGGKDGFERVLDLVEAASRALLTELS
jgi:protein-tyrosine phosphatase